MNHVDQQNYSTVPATYCYLDYSIMGKKKRGTWRETQPVGVTGYPYHCM